MVSSHPDSGCAEILEIILSVPEMCGVTLQTEELTETSRNGTETLLWCTGKAKVSPRSV